MGKITPIYLARWLYTIADILFFLCRHNARFPNRNYDSKMEKVKLVSVRVSMSQKKTRDNLIFGRLYSYTGKWKRGIMATLVSVIKNPEEHYFVTSVEQRSKTLWGMICFLLKSARTISLWIESVACWKDERCPKSPFRPIATYMEEPVALYALHRSLIGFAISMFAENKAL